MIPYPIKNKDQIKSAGYISGAMTHPDYQGKGIMSEMLNYSFEVMQKKGYDFSFLIPQKEWLFDYYARFGYEKTFPTSIVAAKSINIAFTQEIILRDKTIQISTQSNEIDLSDFFITYSRFLTENDSVVLKTKKQIAIILEDFFDEKGVLFFNDWGIAFCLKKEKYILIKEFFYFDNEIATLFLSAITEYYQTENLFIQTYNTSTAANHRGMIKKLTDHTAIPSDIYMSMMLD